MRANKGCQLEIGGIADHVHMLVQLSPAISVSDAIRDIKSNSSKWIRDQSEVPDSFAWQKGYGAFTVSCSNIEVVRDYIKRQPDHHRQKTFEQEYIRLLRAHEITFQPEHLFENEHHG
ncbi:MAG: IS200/IS605 family transposase [Fuerstiella sp.]